MMTNIQERHRQATLTRAHHSHEKKLVAYAFFKTSDRALGEDMVQETFMKTWAYLAGGGEIDLMEAFLYHILNNLIVDEYRKHKAVSLDTLIEKGIEPSDDHHGHIFNFLDGKAALLLIARLPVTYQKVMRMRYVQDLSLQEMSLITGQSKTALSVQVHRGLEKLKVLYSVIDPSVRNSQVQVA